MIETILTLEATEERKKSITMMYRFSEQGNDMSKTITASRLIRITRFEMQNLDAAHQRFQAASNHSLKCYRGKLESLIVEDEERELPRLRRRPRSPPPATQPAMSSAPPHRPSRRSRSCSASPRDGAASFTPPPAVSSPLDRVSWSVSSSDCSPPCQGLQDASRPAGLLDSTSSAVPVPARSPRASFAQVCDSSAAAKIPLPVGRRSSSPAAAAPVLAIGDLGSSRPLHAGVAPVADGTPAARTGPAMPLLV